MIYKIYAVRDNVADDTLTIFMSPNAGMAIRENLPSLARVRPIKDIDLYEIGEIDSKKMEIKPTISTKHSWEEYKFPEVKPEQKKEEQKEKTNNAN